MEARNVRTGTVRVMVKLLAELMRREESEFHVWNVRYVLEGLLWESVREILVLDAVLCKPTTAAKSRKPGPLPNSTFFFFEVRCEEWHLAPF